jgi:hypothetical protein
MHPGVAHLQALFAAVTAGRHFLDELLVAAPFILQAIAPREPANKLFDTCQFSIPPSLCNSTNAARGAAPGQLYLKLAFLGG